MPDLKCIKGPSGKLYPWTMGLDPWCAGREDGQPERLWCAFERACAAVGADPDLCPDDFRAFGESRGYTTVRVRLEEVSDES